MASKKPPVKVERRAESDSPRSQKPIRLNDLIPTRDVSGGRSVFGSPPAIPRDKRKPQK